MCEHLEVSHSRIRTSALSILQRLKSSSPIPPERMAVVFDIDDTLLNKRTEPLTHMVELYRECCRIGFVPILITARPGFTHSIEVTQMQLQRIGLHGWQHLYFIPPGHRDPYAYKIAARRNVHENGLQVVMSLGDQPWDIGEHGGVGFIVPTCSLCR